MALRAKNSAVISLSGFNMDGNDQGLSVKTEYRRFVHGELNGYSLPVSQRGAILAGRFPSMDLNHPIR